MKRPPIRTTRDTDLHHLAVQYAIALGTPGAGDGAYQIRCRMSNRYGRARTNEVIATALNSVRMVGL